VERAGRQESRSTPSSTDGVAAPKGRVRRLVPLSAGKHRIALGLVVGLDYRDSGLDIHALQRLKLHPFVRRLPGAASSSSGERRIEGGYWSLPERRTGDACSCSATPPAVDVPSLKGIHYAMWSGATRRAIFARERNDVGYASLRE
jgi:flavin-dependent dehydrogenase